MPANIRNELRPHSFPLIGGAPKVVYITCTMGTRRIAITYTTTVHYWIMDCRLVVCMYYCKKWMCLVYINNWLRWHGIKHWFYNTVASNYFFVEIFIYPSLYSSLQTQPSSLATYIITSGSYSVWNDGLFSQQSWLRVLKENFWTLCTFVSLTFMI